MIFFSIIIIRNTFNCEIFYKIIIPQLQKFTVLEITNINILEISKLYYIGNYKKLLNYSNVYGRKECIVKN